MEIDSFIDKVGEKYGYNLELMQALKRCIPAMIEGKSKEDIKLLMDTLDRVQIYVFDKQPSKEEIDEIKKEKFNGRNEHVKIISYDKGEYGKLSAPGSYISEPIFDYDMNIVDRVGFIYLTNLYDNSETAKFYGTKINLSHLIHELGHAWGAEKGEFLQKENGDFTISVGTARFQDKVDRTTHTVEEVEVNGLYVEEALNSIEEEETLYRLLNIKDFHEIPGYVNSNYQGTMTSIMRNYIEKLGKSTFENIRIQKDQTEIERLQEVFNETSFRKDGLTEDYYIDKIKIFESAQNTSMSDIAKKGIKDFFEEYKELYFSPAKNSNFLENLDNVMEQLFNFNSIRYYYDITKDDVFESYQQTILSIIEEGCVPLNQATEILKNRTQVSLSNLAKDALKDDIRMDEVTSMERAEKGKGEKEIGDMPNK